MYFSFGLKFEQLNLGTVMEIFAKQVNGALFVENLAIRTHISAIIAVNEIPMICEVCKRSRQSVSLTNYQKQNKHKRRH